MTNEGAVRDALHDLTADQPVAPVDRFTAVRRRHVRRRVAMTTGAAVMAAIATVGALLVSGPLSADRATPANRAVPSWALPWPDHRDDSVSQKLLDQAVTAWRAHAHVGRPTQIVWYVGQEAVHRSWIVAIFEAEVGGERHLVTAQALTSTAEGGQGYGPEQSGVWTVHDVPAPEQQPALVGLNLGDTTVSGSGNWILVLTRPSESGFRWQAAGSPGGVATLARGLAVVDTGTVRGPVEVTFDRPGPAISFAVAVPGDPASGAPQLEFARSVDTGGRKLLAGSGGQGSGAIVLGLANSRVRVTLIARCYGRSPLHVTLDDGPFAVNVPCDDNQHEYAGPALQPTAGGHSLFFTGSPYTAYDIALVRSR